MFNPKEAFEPVEELSTDLWALYGVPDVLIADNCKHHISAMFSGGGVVRIECVPNTLDETSDFEGEN